MARPIAGWLVAAMFGLAACGGSTTTEDSTKSDTTTEATTTKPKAKAKPKPKPQSKRAKLKACLEGVGYSEDDVPDLVPGTMKQQRLLATCPRTPTEDDIAGILTRSVQNW